MNKKELQNTIPANPNDNVSIENLKREKKKKRLVGSLCAIIIVITMIVCIAVVADFNNDPQKVSEKVSENEYFKIGDVVKLNDWNVTINSFSFKDKIEVNQLLKYTPGEGNIYLVLDVTVKNEGNSATSFLRTISTDTVEVVYDDQYNYSSTYLVYDKDLHDVTLNPLQEKNGVIVFEVTPEMQNSTDKPLMVKLKDSGSTMKVKLR